MRLTPREAQALVQADQRRRAAQLQRDHELELLLNAGVSLEEARTLVSKGSDHV